MNHLENLYYFQPRWHKISIYYAPYILFIFGRVFNIVNRPRLPRHFVAVGNTAVLAVLEKGRLQPCDDFRVIGHLYVVKDICPCLVTGSC